MERLVLASMGPGCFYPGNAPRISHPRPRSACFNGAGMFLSRKWALCVVGEATAGALQWGPDVSIPEMPLRRLMCPRTGWLQWGRDVSIPEILRWSEHCAQWMQLQWGRDVSIPEIRITAPVRCCLTWLQWGRDVSIPEIKSLPERQERRASFNGAGMFLSRKSLRDIAGTRGLAASMGPGCFYPGNTDGRHRGHRRYRASMGPGCFYPGNGAGLRDLQVLRG